MIVFDVVYIVPPGAPTSVPEGRWLIEHHDRDDRARARCSLMNEINRLPGARFDVESHDEECPGRARYPGETRETLQTPGQCRCQR